MFLLLLILLFGILLYIHTSMLYNYNNSITNVVNVSIHSSQDHEGFVVYTPGCKIPDFQLFNKEIKQFINKPSKTQEDCNNGIPALFESNLTSVYIINSSLPAYGVTDINKLRCCYNVFWRMDSKPRQPDDNILLSKHCYSITNAAKIDYDFIKITCYYNNNLIYKDMFSFVSMKTIKKLPTLQNPPPLNVFILGLDGVSRLNLHRQLDKTVDYLKSIGATELLGYNKVADNTYPNLIPVLTGLSEQELSNACVPHILDHFDGCPFIWNKYKQKGYITAYGEDTSRIGLFNYERNGFLKQPTDYSYSYFSNFVEHEIGNVGFDNVNLCEGSRLIYKDFQEYIKKFIITMNSNNLPYFGFFWEVSLTHDDLNMPKLGDNDYYNFFKFFKDKGMFNNTAVIFLSDHGIRYGPIRGTYQGKMEERLPFVFILLPDWFKLTYPEGMKNLENNTRRLTSPFDIHETLLDLLNHTNINYFTVKNETRGISLFKEIGTDRTCEHIGIVSHFCTCQQSVEIGTNTTIVAEAASVTVKYINNQLLGYTQCAHLNLAEISNARLMTQNQDLGINTKTILDYMITFRTRPGNAVFEATVRSNPDGNLSVIGSISRLNLYGNQSSCISDFHLKLYCFCTNLFV